VVLVDDANHLVLIDRPDVVSKQLQNFLGATLDSTRRDGRRLCFTSQGGAVRPVCVPKHFIPLAVVASYGMLPSSKRTSSACLCVSVLLKMWWR
jgi:hypothetical protein